jgi:cytidylate kinase
VACCRESGRIAPQPNGARRAHPDAAKITAPPETRAQRVGAAEELDDSKAARAIKKSDADRADYLKRFYRVAEELHYDLVINIEAVSIEQAAALISHSAGLDTG